MTNPNSGSLFICLHSIGNKDSCYLLISELLLKSFNLSFNLDLYFGTSLKKQTSMGFIWKQYKKMA